MISFIKNSAYLLLASLCVSSSSIASTPTVIGATIGFNCGRSSGLDHFVSIGYTKGHDISYTTKIENRTASLTVAVNRLPDGAVPGKWEEMVKRAIEGLISKKLTAKSAADLCGTISELVLAYKSGEISEFLASEALLSRFQ